MHFHFLFQARICVDAAMFKKKKSSKQLILTFCSLSFFPVYLMLLLKYRTSLSSGLLPSCYCSLSYTQPQLLCSNSLCSAPLPPLSTREPPPPPPPHLPRLLPPPPHKQNMHTGNLPFRPWKKVNGTGKKNVWKQLAARFRG